MSSASASSQAPLDANKLILDHVIHYRSRPGIDLRPGCTNCDTLDRLVQLIPAEWTWTRDKNDCHREGLEQLIASDGHKIYLLEAKINLEDVYGSEDFRMKMGLGDLDVSGKGVWVTKGLLTAWTKLLKRYMEKGTWSEITDKPKLEVYKPIDRQFRSDSLDIIELGTRITGQYIVMKFKKLFSYSSTCSKGPAPIEPELYLITYPEKLAKEGNVPDEKKIKALTNLPFLEEWVFKLMKDVDFQGWEVIKIGGITYEKAKGNYKIEDGDPVEIPEGEEWHSDGKGRWATFGGMSTHFIARNERDIKEAKEKDGGAVPIDEDLAHGNTGDSGWITKGYDIDIGFTNSSVVGKELIKALARHPDLPRWEVVDLSALSKIAKERILNHYNIKKEDLYEPHGLHGLTYCVVLSMLELAKLHKIQYEWNSGADCFVKIGYTNKKVIADNVKSIWEGKIHVELILVKNQEELKKLREEDGGPKYPSQPLTYEGEAEGWITDGSKFYLQRSNE
ncbi:uncharacterized protein J4E78_009050 [Alternaria triticimaculans]|uniref:uncharacterized protein n=1 Tax=Alternaria triticimaculans TaxID=297637 RepID=UPI0020C2450C|nr:uncharacterized protein J4E78_009050 [Alternaria triticimaculans]KAI4647077.1 hypothetical protein J4E78_009050 [Alternaria triticimaculans]